MTTSGSVDFSVTRDNIIEDALRDVGAIGPDDSASANQITHAARLLNSITKAWQAYGLQLWARKVGWILPQTDVNEIDLGPTGDHASLTYTQTALSADAALGATTITVDSATGISNGYYIGVETDSGMWWTTVNGAPSGTTVTLTTGLDVAASDDNYVYVYQTKLQRPIRIVEAYLRDEVGNTEYEIDVVPKSTYEGMGAKATDATPNMIAYDPHLTDGRAYIYPRFTDGDKLIKIVFQRPFEDFDATGDTPDVPQEWYRTLRLALALDLAPTYGLPVADRRALREEKLLAFDEVSGNEPEEGSLLIRPDDQGR